jgi:hypothetical protein
MMPIEELELITEELDDVARGVGTTYWGSMSLEELGLLTEWCLEELGLLTGGV